MTLCVPLLGVDPSSPVPGPLTRPTPPLPPCLEALDFVMVTLPPETFMSFLAKTAPAREWQRRSTAAYTYARIRSSCLSPEPETLNPETESGTSWDRAWACSPLYSSHYTRV